jgi:ATP synthase protein I
LTGEWLHVSYWPAWAAKPEARCKTALISEGSAITNRPPHRDRIAAFGLASVGIELGASIGIGYWVGSWMDERYDTAPWFLVVWVLIGVTAGFRSLFRAAKKAMNENQP